MSDRIAIRDQVPPWRCTLALAAVSALMAGCGGGTAATGTDFAGQVDLGNGRTIYMECREAGARSSCSSPVSASAPTIG